jgi:hypothetical protein
MVTATESYTTKTVKRPYLLQLQVRNLLSRTTAISQDSLKKIVDKGIGNRWLRKVSVYGFDMCNRGHIGLELEIDWVTHTLALALVGEEVTINKTKFMDDCAPEVTNAIEVFIQAVNAEYLRTEWRVFYSKGVDRARVDRELGLQDAAPIAWAGTVLQQSFGVSELKELKVHLLIAEIDERDLVGPKLSEILGGSPSPHPSSSASNRS